MPIVSVQKLEDADKDADSLNKFVNGAETESVKTRLNAEYPTLANAVRQIMETGGFEPFATEAVLLASVPAVEKKAAKALDTKKVWLWDGSKWNDTGLSELDLAKDFSRKYGYIFSGLLTKCEYNTDGSYTISHTELRFEFGGGKSFVLVAPQTDLIIPASRLYYVDLTGAVEGSTLTGQVTPTDHNDYSYGMGAFVEDLKIPLFAHRSGKNGQQIGGKLVENGANPSTTISLNKKINKNSYIVNGNLRYEYLDKSKNTYIIGHDNITISLGSGKGLITLAAAENIKIPLNRMYYVDLDSVSAGDTVAGVITSTDWTSNSIGTGAFVDDMKLPLFSFRSEGVSGRLANTSIDQMFYYPRSNALWFAVNKPYIPTYNHDTHTLSWSGQIVCTGRTRRGRNSIVLSAHSIQFDPTLNYQVAYIDLTKIPSNPSDAVITADIVKIGRYSDVLASPEAFVAEPHQLPIFYKGNMGVRPAPGFFDGLIQGINYEADLTTVNSQIAATNLRIDNISTEVNSGIASKDAAYLEGGKLYVDAATGSKLIADVTPYQFVRQPSYVRNAILSTINKPSLGDNTSVFVADDGSLLYPSAKNLLIVLAGYGQSNSIGSGSSPIPSDNLYNESKSNLLMFNGGYDVRLNYSLTNDVVIDLSNATDFIPLQPSVNSSGNGFTFIEGMARRLQNDLESNLGFSPEHLVFTCGKGGQNIAGLKRGSIPYTNLINAVAKAKEIADAKGLYCYVPVIPFLQGEADLGNSNYANDLIELHTQLNADIKAITGQVADIKMMLFQASSFYTTSLSALTSLSISTSDSRFVLVTPTYHLNFNADFLHYSPQGNYKLGEYFSRAYKDILLKNSFTPVRPKTITKVNSTTLDVEFYCDSPLVLDTSKPAKDNFFGFGIDGIDLSSVSLKDSKTVRVVTASTLPSSGSLTYAMTGQTSPRTQAGIPRGSLRDSSTEKSLVDGQPLYNWCVHFRETF